MAKCGLKCEVYSRVCGYFRPVHTFDGGSTWNKGKQEEFKDRKVYKMYKEQLNERLAEKIA